jgi:hypothetical protein
MGFLGVPVLDGTALFRFHMHRLASAGDALAARFRSFPVTPCCRTTANHSLVYLQVLSCLKFRGLLSEAECRSVVLVVSSVSLFSLPSPSWNDGPHIIVTLWLCNIAMENCLFRDGLPMVYLLKMGGSFHGELLVITR